MFSLERPVIVFSGEACKCFAAERPVSVLLQR